MVIRQRAIQAEDKEIRRQAILDAAEKVYVAQGSRDISMADVAVAAGLAKGTMYLYFPSKEELLLALHESHSDRYFRSLGELLSGPGPVSVDQIIALVHQHMVEPRAFLPLASRCLALMDQCLPEQTALAHAARIGFALEKLGVALERRFPALKPGAGVTLLLQSYALIIGLWQILQKCQHYPQVQDRPEVQFLRREYAAELDHALHALWQGSTQTPAGGEFAPAAASFVKEQK